MDTIKRLLLENSIWSKKMNRVDPGFFKKQAIEQNPDILWIGCSDSRVPPNEIVSSRLGNLFVHRNIANMVYVNDESLLTTLEYAINFLKVKNIVVCGHYGCGGVKAAIDGVGNERLEHWIRCISDRIPEGFSGSHNEIVEYNVRAQVAKLLEIPILKEARSKTSNPKIYGLVYDMETGLLKRVTDMI